ncbi:MAG: thiamine pyrophosphate-binding protein [Burkholderiales bacterium]|nr:thiamine pyrophosphate-binding protein [Burkholderiales bacterium]
MRRLQRKLLNAGTLSIGQPGVHETAITMIRITAAEALLRTLAAEDLRWAFGVVGGKLAPLLQALSRQQRVRYVGVRHESAAAMMAAGVAAGGGGMAIAMAEMGPGGLNLAAGLGGARNNGLPVLALTTDQHRAAAYPHKGMFMDMDLRALFATVTKWNAVVGDARRVPELARQAMREALSGRPGPVHLDLPHDVLAQTVDYADDEFDLAPAHYRATIGPRPAAAAVEAAAALLRGAERPLIVAGGGVIAAGAEALALTLARRLQAPLLPTQMALGVLPSDDPLFIGQGGLIGGEPVLRALAEADVVLAIGCRWSSWMWDEQGPLVRRPQRLIALNTDPAALGAPALHELAMQADAGLALADLLAALGARGAAAPAPGPWLARLQGLRDAHRARIEALAAEPGAVMHPAALALAIGRAMPKDALAVYDGGHTSFWSNDCTPVHAPRTRLHEPGMSHLGFGLPAALALQLLHPGRAVFHLTGDGSFGYTLNELDSARRHGLPVITIVHDNASWGVIGHGQSRAGFEFASGLEGCDYAAIARGFGCHGEVVTEAGQIAGAIDRARASGLPAVIDARTRFVPHPCMPAFGAMNRYGGAG